jgi:transcription elongation factor S-II
MAMDTKEVELKGRAIAKAVNGGDPSSTVLSLLEDLRRGVQASEDLLRSTKIGVTVNRLKTHKDPAVVKQAIELVSKWRADIKKTGGTSGASTPKPAANGASSPVPTPNKPKQKHTVPPEKRNAKEDKVDTNLTKSVTRNSCLKLMYDGLAFMSEECKIHLYHR